MMRKSLYAVLAFVALAACAHGTHIFGAPAPIGQTDPRSTTYQNTGVMTPPANGTWTQATWYQSYGAAGSDTNDCLTSSTPCATVAEIQRRWGGVPVLPQATIINALATPSNAQALADPWNIKAFATKNGSLTIIGPLGTTQTVCTGTLNTVTAKTRTGNTGALQSTFTATTSIDGGTCLPVAGQLVVNTSTPDGGPTHNGRAFVHHLVSGSTLMLTQPFVAVSNPFLGTLPAEVDTWATTDPVTVYQPVGLNMVAFDVEPTDPSVTGLGMSNVLAYGQLIDVTVIDPQTTDAGYNVDPFVVGPFVHVLESWSQRPVVLALNPGNGIQAFVNSVLAGGGSLPSDHSNLTGPVSGNFPATLVYGGALGSSAATINEYAGLVLDGDMIVSGVVNASNSSYGFVYLDTSDKLNVSGTSDFVNHAANPFADGGAPQSVNLYGPGTVNFTGSGRTVFSAGAAMAKLIFGDGGTALQFNGQNLMCTSTLDAGTIKCGITATPANVDTALGTTVVQGCVGGPGGGASLCNGNP